MIHFFDRAFALMNSAIVLTNRLWAWLGTWKSHGRGRRGPLAPPTANSLTYLRFLDRGRRWDKPL